MLHVPLSSSFARRALLAAGFALAGLAGGAIALQQAAAPAAQGAQGAQAAPDAPDAMVSAVSDVKLSGFSLEVEAVVPGSPEAVYDAMTGDVSGWWDHSFSEHPYKLFIEPKPGGGFYELFDEQGNGVRHAEVIWAERGKKLTFVGPLPLNGAPVEIGCTVSYARVDDGHTRVSVLVQAAGSLPPDAGTPTAAVWRHFLVERLLPYMEAGGKKGAGAGKPGAR